MLKSIYKSSIVLLLPIVFILLIFLGPITSSGIDDSSNSEDDGNNPLGIVITSADDKENISTKIKPEEDQRKVSKYPDLGDDQVFPFVAGLGSNEDF